MSTWDVMQGSAGRAVVHDGAATISGFVMDGRPFMVAVSNPVDVMALINSLRSDGSIVIKLPDDEAERMIDALQALPHADA